MDPQRGNTFSCSTCLKTFKTKKYLKCHMLTHDANAKVKCEICGKISKNQITLSAHIKGLHTNRDRPSCDICHQVCTTASNLRRHIRNKHSTMKRPRFPCGFPGCGKTYLNRETVSLHVKTEHAENPVRFSCTLCGKEFKTRPELETHISTHTKEKTYICSTCGRSFSTHDGRKSHQATHVEKSTRRIFKCNLCPHTSLSGENLRKHLQYVHENRRNYPCTFCDKRFLTSSHMKRHVGEIHTSNMEKIHSCDKCKFVSHSKDILAQHVKRHNPANRRQPCYFCEKKFFYFSQLVAHFRRHTQEY